MADSRPSPAERGYGPEHRKLRKRIARIIARGEGICARCGEPIYPDEPWDLGHMDRDRTRYAGSEHQRCNRGTMAHRPPRKRPTESHPGLIDP